MHDQMIADMKMGAEKVFSYDDLSLKAYRKCADKLMAFVNKTMEDRDDIVTLIGGNSIDMLEDNHLNHIQFMQSVLTYRQHELLVKTLPWVYKAYMSKGFLPEYFSEELKCWIKAMTLENNSDLAPIVSVYEKMLSWHKNITLLSQSHDLLNIQPEVLWTDQHQEIMGELLLGRNREVLSTLLDNYQFPEDTQKVYVEVIQPVLYMIGNHWEEGRISVAQEHIAASAASRLMAHLHMKFDTVDHIKGDVVVSTGTNEFHQIGARMVADVLENAGWNVRFLGADIPSNSLGEILDQINPEIVALSVTMDYNVEKIIETVKYIKSRDRWDKIKIMIGGLAINNDPSLHHIIGADAYPVNAIESLAVAERWHLEK